MGSSALFKILVGFLSLGNSKHNRKLYKYTIYYNVNMTETISVRLREEQLRQLETVEKKWQIDRSEVVRRLLAEALKEWKIKNALENLAAHKISIGRAAKECGVTLWEMLDLAKEKNINWTGYDEEDLKKDLSLLK